MTLKNLFFSTCSWLADRKVSVNIEVTPENCLIKKSKVVIFVVGVAFVLVAVAATF